MALRLEANPIIVKELRARMRGGRAFALLTGFLLGLAAVAYGLYLLATRAEQYGATILSSQIGQTLFAGLSFTVLILVCIITPAVTAGTVSGERERLTYEMLVATPLPPAQLLWGKIIAAMSYVMLIIVAAIPLGSIVFIFGGITLRDLLKAMAIIIMTAITSGTLGIFASTLLRRTARAAATAYLLTAIVVFGLLFSAGLWQARKESNVPMALLAPNPVSAMAATIAVMTPNPSGGFGIAVPMPQPMMEKGMGMPFPAGGFYGGSLDLPGWHILSAGVFTRVPPEPWVNGMPPQPTIRPIWRLTLITEWLATLMLFWLALHLVRPRRHWRPGREDLIMSVLVTGSLIAAGIWQGWWSLPV